MKRYRGVREKLSSARAALRTLMSEEKILEGGGRWQRQHITML